MRASIDQPYSGHIHTATVQGAKCDHNSAGAVATVWRSALLVFILRAPAILLVAMVCIAGPTILCLFASLVLHLELYPQISGPFVTWRGINELTESDGSINLMGQLLLAQATLGTIPLIYARGVIARLALGDVRAAPSLILACRMAKTNFLSLLIGTLSYSACIAIGAVGVNAILHDTHFDLRRVGARGTTVPTYIHTFELRTLDALVPNPGSPFGEFVPLLRTTTFANPFHHDEGNQYLQHVREGHLTSFIPAPIPTVDNPISLLTISLFSVSLLFFAELFLRFTPMMAMRAYKRQRTGLITPMLQSVHFGLRYFRSLIVHPWLLRLVFVVSYSLLFILPVVLSEGAMPLIARLVFVSPTSKWLVVLILSSHSLITALFTAFSIVYDARLVMHYHPFGGNLAQVS